MSEKEKTQTVIGADITHGAVIDIGGSAMGAAILTRLRDALYDTPEGSPIVLPDELLYDDKGLAIWAEIIFTPENYQATDEMKLFEANSPEIAKHIPEESVMVDLGAGYVLPPFSRLSLHCLFLFSCPHTAAGFKMLPRPSVFNASETLNQSPSAVAYKTN